MRRIQLRLSRKAVSGLVGRSEEWLRLVENGQQQLDNVRVIVRLAQVLGFGDFRELIDIPGPARRSSTNSAAKVSEVFGAAIIEYPELRNLRSGQSCVLNTPKDDLRPRDECSSVVSEMNLCRMIWRESPSRFSQLSQRLPRLIRRCRELYWQSKRPEILDLLAQCYHLTAEIMIRIRSYDLAWTVSDRAVAISCDQDKTLMAAVGGWHIANTLLHIDQAAECYKIALDTAEQMSNNSTEHEQLRNALRLLAAKAAAARGEMARSEQLMLQSQHAVNRGEASRQVLGITFGAREVAIARMEISLARNDFDQAIRDAEQVVLGDNALPGRARYYIALARAFIERGDEMASTFALSKAADASPEDLLYDPDAQTAVHKLQRRNNPLLRRDLTRITALAGLG